MRVYAVKTPFRFPLFKKPLANHPVPAGHPSFLSLRSIAMLRFEGRCLLIPSSLHPFIPSSLHLFISSFPSSPHSESLRSRYFIPFLLVSQRLYRIQLGGLGGGVPAADDAYNGTDDKAHHDPQPRYGEGRFHEDG